MSLTLTRTVYDAMLAAAQSAVPIEACGLLAGTDARVTCCHVLTNADASPDHYRMKPEDQFAAIQSMRAAKLNMLAIWHSHPATPARMSDEDMRLAYTPDILYVIVSLADPSAPVVRAYAVRDGETRETPVIIQT